MESKKERGAPFREGEVGGKGVGQKPAGAPFGAPQREIASGMLGSLLRMGKKKKKRSKSGF